MHSQFLGNLSTAYTVVTSLEDGQLPRKRMRFYLLHALQTVSSAKPSAHTKENGLFPWGKRGRGVKFTIHVHLGMELDL
jgi:hypothetical protein